MDRITMTLKDYLESGYTLPANLDNFIKLNIDGNEYDIKELFTKRNLHKEIGSETQELFKHNLEVLVDETLTTYNPKLKLLQDNFSKLMDRTAEEKTDGSSENDGQNENYLQPANTSATKLSDMSKVHNENEYHETKQKIFSYLKGNAELLRDAYKLDSIIGLILTKLDRAFIGEY